MGRISDELNLVAAQNLLLLQLLYPQCKKVDSFVHLVHLVGLGLGFGPILELHISRP